MPTGACGIHCDVCKLNLLGICSSCGPGKSLQASRKLAAQLKKFGGTCPILHCAAMNRIDHCMRDCNRFPCENFQAGYPYSRSFLKMQARRLKERSPALTPHNTPVEVPPEYWDELQTRDIQTLCNLTLCQPGPAGGLIFRFLNQAVWVDPADRCLKRQKLGEWEKSADPLLELLALLYFNHVRSLYPMGRDIVSPRDLKEAHYFQGAHALNLGPLLARYGNDPEGFETAARFLDGSPTDMGDIGYRLHPFPRVPLYFLYWKGDAEFSASLTVLFDRSVEHCFSAAAIWGLYNRVSQDLLKGPPADSRL